MYQREKKVPLHVPQTKSVCTFAQSDQRLRCPHEKGLYPWPLSCVNAQADLNLRWAHVSECTY